FDTVNVVEVGFEQPVCGKRCVVEVDTYPSVSTRRDHERADAADLEVVAGEVAFGEGNVGDRLQQVVPAGQPLVLKLVGVERRNWDRNVLDRFLTSLSCNDDFF